MRTVAIVVAALLHAAAAQAQTAVVEAVQYPAWIERGGLAAPLIPGTALASKDTIRTGDNARVELKLAEGSVVKLGERAQFTVEKMEVRGTLTAAMSVLRGAFRFTTDALRKSSRRDVRIRVKNVTAGIRGTDVWGKSTDESDLVCLLEGAITVGSEGHPEVKLDQPLDFYRKKSGEAPAVAKVDPEKVKQWAKETDLAPDGAIGRKGGTWRVIAALVPSRDNAMALNRHLRSMGYPSQIAGGEGGAPTTVYVGGLAGENEARSVMANLRGVPGIITPSVRQGP